LLRGLAAVLAESLWLSAAVRKYFVSAAGRLSLKSKSRRPESQRLSARTGKAASGDA